MTIDPTEVESSSAALTRAACAVSDERALKRGRIAYWAARFLWIVPAGAYYAAGWTAMGIALAVVLLIYFGLVVWATPPAVRIDQIARIERLYRAVARTRGLVCPQCEQELPERPTAGNCPRCSRGYSIAKVREHWGFSPSGEHVGGGADDMRARFTAAVQSSVAGDGEIPAARDEAEHDEAKREERR
jgi:hypothetical protein